MTMKEKVELYIDSNTIEDIVSNNTKAKLVEYYYIIYEVNPLSHYNKQDIVEHLKNHNASIKRAEAFEELFKDREKAINQGYDTRDWHPRC